jgi:hypothetical protein
MPYDDDLIQAVRDGKITREELVKTRQEAAVLRAVQRHNLYQRYLEETRKSGRDLVAIVRNHVCSFVTREFFLYADRNLLEKNDPRGEDPMWRKWADTVVKPASDLTGDSESFWLCLQRNATDTIVRPMKVNSVIN